MQRALYLPLRLHHGVWFPYATPDQSIPSSQRRQEHALLLGIPVSSRLAIVTLVLGSGGTSILAALRLL